MDVGVNTVVDESKRMDDVNVRLAWQIRFSFQFGALMVLAHRLFLGRAALQCPQFGLGVLHLGGAGVHRVHGGSTLASTLASHLSWRTSRSCWFRSSSLTTSAVCISTPAIPVTASTVSRRAHLRGQYACILPLPPLQQLLIAARLGCQPRRLYRARRVSISTRRASVADNSKIHYLLLLPSTQNPRP
jgi:hypothetical protein